MAFNPAPSSWLGAGYTVASNTVRFNTADAASNKTLAEVTDAEANPTTGDIRKVAFGLCEALAASFLTTLPADRPQRMTISKNSIVDNATGRVTVTYQFQFVNQILTQDVANEPS